MNPSTLVDWEPLLRLLLLGLCLGLGPLAWVWLRTRRDQPDGRLRALTVLTLFLTFDLVLFGAFTRLTDSGLGCPDWPGCYGSVSPLGAQHEIGAAQLAQPTGPVTHQKAWIEMIHRYLATGVGMLILTLMLFSWLHRRRIQVSPWWPTLTLVWVCLQGAFGAFTVTLKLMPVIVTLHLLGGMVLLALLQIQSQRYAATPGPGQPQRPRTKALVLATLVALWVQLALGAWVSTNYAVLACNEFPQCQGGWWPHMDFAQGFALWRPLGQTATGDFIGFEALTAIHYTHRLAAYGLFVLLGWLAWHIRRMDGLQKLARWTAMLALWQLLTGLSNVVLGWPLLAAVAHTGGAAGLVLATTTLALRTLPQASIQSAASFSSPLGASATRL